jgi:hypothetical protein
MLLLPWEQACLILNEHYLGMFASLFTHSYKTRSEGRRQRSEHRWPYEIKSALSSVLHHDQNEHYLGMLATLIPIACII